MPKLRDGKKASSGSAPVLEKENGVSAGTRAATRSARGSEHASRSRSSEPRAEQHHSSHKRRKSAVPSASAVGQGIDDFIHDDAHHLVEHFKHSWDVVTKSLKRPNVLLAGITGVGKSSVVNSIFGCKMAAEGTGKPITQNFQKFESPGKAVVVYDSKGLETGNIDEFVEQTHDFFEKHRYTKKKKAENCIHVIWYVINSASCRIQPSEERLWREVFNCAPLIFLLNKSDISSDEDRATLREVIRGMNLPNLVGIYDCRTQHYAHAVAPTKCLNCGSDDLMVRAKKKMWKCGDCDQDGTMVYTTGLEDIIGATISVLPMVAREAFISAQTVSFSTKEERAKIVIREFSNDYRQIRMSSTLLVHIAKMLTRLSILWEFKEHGHLYGKQIAEELLTSFSLRDKVYLFMHRNKHAHWRAVALGVIWNRCVRYLARRVFHDSIELNMSLRDLDEEWSEVLTETFQHLTDENLDEVEAYLDVRGLEAVLEKEMPSRDPDLPAGFKASQPKIRVGYSVPAGLSAQSKRSGGGHSKKPSGEAHAKSPLAGHTDAQPSAAKAIPARATPVVRDDIESDDTANDVSVGSLVFDDSFPSPRHFDEEVGRPSHSQESADGEGGEDGAQEGTAKSRPIATC